MKCRKGENGPLGIFSSSLSQRLENILSHSCTKPGVKDAIPSVTTARRASVMCSADMACVSRLHWPAAPKMAQLVVTARSSFETDCPRDAQRDNSKRAIKLLLGIRKRESNAIHRYLSI